MTLFHGQAWFSPRVPITIKNLWTLNGGSLAGHHPNPAQPTYLFCDSSDDPWFEMLSERSIAIFRCQWVARVVEAQFRVPISSYVIDGRQASPPPAYVRILHNAPKHLQTAGAQERMVQSPCEGKSLTGGSSNGGSNVIRKKLEEDGDGAFPPHVTMWKAFTKSTPFVDLRRQGTKPVPMQAIRVESVEQFTGPDRSKPHGPLDAFNDLVSDSLRGSACKVISVSVALESLDSISIDNATQFIPGGTHLGQEFRCFYTTS